MHNLNIKTFQTDSQKSDFQLFILSKGLNSGKPLDDPCPNCFVLVCESLEELQFYKSVAYMLWKKQVFTPYLSGSVVPFIRINDFKKVFLKGISKFMDNPQFTKMMTQFQAFEALECTYLKSLSLIEEAKKIICLKMFQE
jgi:hypothetical protein